jgi:hypothetical protein
MRVLVGEEVPYFGLNICGVAIGNEEYVQQHNLATIATICTNTTNTSRRLGDVSAHAAHAANTYSLSKRVDYIYSTNSSNTLPSESMELYDKTMDEAHKCGLGFSPPNPKHNNEFHATLDPQFTTDVLRLKFNQGGVGIRTTKDQSVFLNTMANIGPQPHEDSST